MFKSVIIAEDYESTNISIQKTLADLGISHTDYVYYCDDALIRVKKGVSDNKPYDLLITDLSFEPDSQEQKLSGGQALITAVKKAQLNLKVLVFSAENKPAVIDSLFYKLGIDGYVRKARNDAHELKSAIQTIYKGKRYFPVLLRQATQQKNAHEFTIFDTNIITLLSRGIHQKDIPVYLQKNNIKPSGLSSVEKRLSLTKQALNFSTNEQLVAFCKDMGII